MKSGLDAMPLFLLDDLLSPKLIVHSKLGEKFKARMIYE